MHVRRLSFFTDFHKVYFIYRMSLHIKGDLNTMEAWRGDAVSFAHHLCSETLRLNLFSWVGHQNMFDKRIVTFSKYVSKRSSLRVFSLVTRDSAWRCLFWKSNPFLPRIYLNTLPDWTHWTHYSFILWHFVFSGSANLLKEIFENRVHSSFYHFQIAPLFNMKTGPSSTKPWPGGMIHYYEA